MYHSVNQLLKETTDKYSSFFAFSFKTGFRTKTYTYKEVYETVRKFPDFFARKGIVKGDKILILSLNRPEYTMLILGAFLSGIIIVPIDYRTNQETIEKFSAKTRPKAIFTLSSFKSLFQKIKADIYDMENLPEVIEKCKLSDTFSKIQENDLAAILFTSGTTGEPKGTMITYKNIIVSLNEMRCVFTLPSKFKILSILPLSHILELVAGFLITYSCGCNIHYIERVNSITILQALQRYGVQGMATVPQMLRIILFNLERQITEQNKKKKWENAQKIAPFLPIFLRRLLFNELHAVLGGSFSFFACGSAPLEVKLADIWERTGITVLEGYGASETTSFISTNTFKDKKLGTCGKVLPGIKIKQTQEGELLVKGDNVVSGYYEDLKKTTEAFHDGWFNTGDIVNIDKDGRIRIVGRDKFKIVLSDGKKVYPEDIEKKINENSEVIDSVVFGLPTDEGEIVHAQIILKNPKFLKEIIEKTNEKLNVHERIMDYGIWSQADFPRTKTLKVDREQVKSQIIANKKNNSKVNYQTKINEQDKLISILLVISGLRNIQEKDNLATDLKLDSLKRIELLALIEEEIGISVDELKITSKTTVKDLRQLISEGKTVMISDGRKLNKWQFSNFMDSLRIYLQDYISFPIFNTGIKIKTVHPENLKKIDSKPHLFIFNHCGVYDVFCILRILPKDIRKKLAIATTAQMWDEALYHRIFGTFFGNCFPFVKAESQNAVRGNFDRVGELLDKGYNIMIAPEGNITHTGEILQFHTGAGYIAVEMELPVIPFRINGYFDLWPENTKRKLNLFWPEKFGTAEVAIGEPINFMKDTSYEDATKILHDTVLNLK